MTEIHIKKGYKTMQGFIRAVRYHTAKITGEYPEDVLTFCNSNEDMESVIRRTGTYYYESPEFNIDVQFDSHIYLHVMD